MRVEEKRKRKINKEKSVNRGVYSLLIHSLPISIT